MNHHEDLGPVSELLASEVRQRVQQQGIVVWLDGDEHFTGFVDRLRAAAPGYRIEGYRGSHLELLLALEGQTSGVEKPRLLVHLPGFNEETVKQTPLYELYRAGVRYRKSLRTLVEEAASGKVKPEAIGAFEGGLEEADAWLRAEMDRTEGGLAAQLRAISVCALADDLIGGGFVARQLDVEAARATVYAHLEVALALPTSWREDALGKKDEARAGDVAYAMASWALAVEYVDDLTRPPQAPRLVGIEAQPKPIRAACRELAAHLRERHPDFYRPTAEETVGLIAQEEEVSVAKDLGRIDTFAFEEQKVRDAAIDALAAHEFGLAAEYADARVHGDSFWVAHDPMRQAAWELIAMGAGLGQAIDAAGPRLDAVDHHAALDRYQQLGEAVDRAHRRLEQARRKLLVPQVRSFEKLRAQLDSLREVWRAWADAWAEDFNALCARKGFAAPAPLQQRNLFEEAVRPHAQEELTAYFVVDALRYEMGEELRRAFEQAARSTVQLDARYAELPTNTEVGMNALAPVADGGKLKPAMKGGAFRGFQSGDFRVKDPETRRRAMHDRVGGATCPLLTLADVLSRDTAKLRQTVKQAKLVVVHSDEIDRAGEKGVGTSVFDDVMQQLRSAWQLLREAGVKRFVVTADHGFLLLDGAGGPPVPFGRKIDPNRRHMIAPPGAPTDGVVSVPLAELGYEGVDEHAFFPRGTAPFDTGGKKRRFVHGGNSLQERVIPVLTVVHRTHAGSTNLRYRVEAEQQPGVGGMHCLSASIALEGQAGLGFAGAKELELVLRVVDIPGVTVELCQARYGAQLVNGALMAQVGERFELFFRLTGATDARALVALHHPSRTVELVPGGPEARFAVGVASRGAAPAPTEPAPSTKRAWLKDLPEGGVRTVFAHIDTHGVCEEGEAMQMLGGARGLRRFSAKFEEYAKVAPFEARIDVVGGLKRYVREGGAS